MFNFTFLISAILFIMMDSFYFHFMKGHFVKQIQAVQGSKLQINFMGAALTYLFLIIGLNYFIIKPKKSVQDAFLFGIVIYGVYEATNYALFKEWSLITLIMDTLWGGVLFATTAFLVRLLPFHL